MRPKPPPLTQQPHKLLNLTVTLDILTLLVGYTHVFLAPYTKVEESFNLHAVHDVLAYGIGRQGVLSYDHLVHPSPVPRTFVGAVVLAYTTKLCMPLLPYIAYLPFVTPTPTKFHIQILTRLILSTYSSLSLIYFRRRFCATFTPNSSAYIHLSTAYSLLLLTTFHVPFWSSRTLPNTYAFVLCNVAGGFLVSGWMGHAQLRADGGSDSKKNLNSNSNADLRKALAILTFTTVVFRAELAALLIPLVLLLLLTHRLSLLGILITGSASGIISLGLTVSIDTYFHPSTHFTYAPPIRGWPNGWVWPELVSVTFNVVEGKASEWGVSPWYTYPLALPKLLLFAFPLAFVPIFVVLREVCASMRPSVGAGPSVELKADLDSLTTTATANTTTEDEDEAESKSDTQTNTTSTDDSHPISPPPTSHRRTQSYSEPALRFQAQTQARTQLTLLIPYITMLALLSALKHKEWRFIVYVVPMFIGVGAWGFVWIWEWSKLKEIKPSKGVRGWLGVCAFLVGGIYANLAFTALLTIASRVNYPGGEAMWRLHELVGVKGGGVRDVKVHISNLAAQSGASLFLELGSSASANSDLNGTMWVYDKTEHLTIQDLDEAGYDYLLSEVPPWDGWGVLGGECGVIAAFDGWGVELGVMKGVLKGVMKGVGGALAVSNDSGDGSSSEGGEKLNVGKVEGVVREILRMRGVVRMKRKDVLWILERRRVRV